MIGKKHDMWKSSEYFNRLEKEDKIRYKEKLALNDKTTITNPYGLSNNWKTYVSLLPDI